MSILFLEIASYYDDDMDPGLSNMISSLEHGERSVSSGNPASGAAGKQCAPTPAPNSPNVLPAVKEFIGIAAVGLVCAAAASNPVTAMGIAACLLTIAAKASNKL